MAQFAAPPPLATRTCRFCFDDGTESFLVKTCNEHFECNDCLQWTCEKAAKHEIMYPPPSCCGSASPFNITNHAHLFSTAFVAQYHAAEAEYATPIAQRVYCAYGRCAKFLPPNDPAVICAKDQSRCKHCDTTTCRKCSERVPCAAESTIPHRCPTRAGERTDNDRRLSRLAKKNGWKSCPQCKICIEVRYGCARVRCAMCRHQFCWDCLRPWVDGHMERCVGYDDETEDEDSDDDDDDDEAGEGGSEAEIDDETVDYADESDNGDYDSLDDHSLDASSAKANSVDDSAEDNGAEDENAVRDNSVDDNFVDYDWVDYDIEGFVDDIKWEY